MRILKIMAMIAVGILAIASIVIGGAWASLPRTSCDVTPAQIEKLELERMNYSQVATTFGCDGVLKSRKDVGGKGELVLEDYSWRIAAWPYGKFSGHFINGTLQGTEQYWLNLKLSGNKD